MNIYPVNISFKNESKIKRFSGRQKLRESTAIRPALQEILLKKFIGKQEIKRELPKSDNVYA